MYAVQLDEGYGELGMRLGRRTQEVANPDNEPFDKAHSKDSDWNGTKILK
jgi:hypothetical protein